MLIGIGTDIIEIQRIKKAMENKHFLTRNFTKNEIAYLESKKLNPQTLAGMFCAKEAFAKAIGTGFRRFCLVDVEVCHTADFKPYLKMYNLAAAMSESLNFQLSISHCRDYATATVIAQECDKQ